MQTPTKRTTYTKKQLRRTFTHLLEDPEIAEFLSRPAKGGLCGIEKVAANAGSGASMLYETEDGEKRSIRICFDTGSPERAPVLATFGREKVIAIGSQYLQECSAEELKVRVAMELGCMMAEEHFAPNTTTHNSRKVVYYASSIDSFCDQRLKEGVNCSLEDAEVKMASRMLKLHYLRSALFCFIRGGAREAILESDRLAVRYCGLEAVVRYLAVCSSRDNDVDRIETLNRIEAIAKDARYGKPELRRLRLGLSDKNFIGPRVSWARRGEGYEVSSKGDTRFSAMYAIMPDGRTLEMHYQCCVKGYDPGGTAWRLGKGKPPLDTSIDLFAEYTKLWRIWVQRNPEAFANLLEILPKYNYLLTDCFATTPVNQAAALAKLCNEHYGFKERAL